MAFAKKEPASGEAGLLLEQRIGLEDDLCAELQDAGKVGRGDL